MGSHLCDGYRFAIVVRVEVVVVATTGRHWGHRGERNGELGRHSERRVAPHPGAVGKIGGHGLAGRGGIRFGGGGSLGGAGKRVGPGGLQGLF